MVSADLVNRLRAMVAGKLRDRAEIDDVVQEVLWSCPGLVEGELLSR